MNLVSAGLIELAKASRLFIVASEERVGGSRKVATAAHAYYRVVAGDLAEAMLTRKWVAGEVFVVAKAGVASSGSVTTTSSGQVFSCIVSPGTPVTESPVVQLAQEVFTSDGYGWRYLFTVSQAYRDKFPWDDGSIVRPFAPLYVSVFDTSFLPTAPIAGTPVCRLDPPLPGVTPYALKNAAGVVTALLLPPGAVTTPRELFAVIQDPLATGSGANATTTVLAGGGVSLAVAAEGGGYAAAKVTVIGDGIGASFTPNIAAGKVVGYTQTSAGTGYTVARAVVTPGENSAVVAALLPSSNADYTRNHTLLSKALTATTSPASSLTAFLVVTDEPFPSARASGPMGDVDNTVEMVGEPLVVARISLAGEFSMTENIQINTAIRTG